MLCITYIHAYIYVHTMSYYSAMRKKEIFLFATTQMDLKGLMLSEITQTENDKYCTASLMQTKKEAS